ncbi:MAG: hypothetical protein H7A21_11245 [Spirochaetales bacterium]|nr:hypothetical protein [Leptospiraceae bacterium]MCP5482001.1 hypothetical protein [Spirochaetales bacterium]MCP5486482.1 hypothetical protein [Spirochaetales bacterium]
MKRRIVWSILIAAAVNLVYLVLVVFVALSAVRNAGDTTAVLSIATGAIKVLSLPMAWLWHLAPDGALPGWSEYAAFLLNSLLWGFLISGMLLRAHQSHT